MRFRSPGSFITKYIPYSQAISTELLASAAPTRIFNAAIPYVQDNDEISSLFRQPYSYHGEGQGGRKHRKIQSTIRTNPQTGREEQVVRFVLQAHIKDDPNESYWSKLKRWLRPIIVEPSLDRQTPQQQPLAAAVKQAEPKSWFETIFHAFIPPKEPVRTSLSRGFTKRRPHLGEFSTGTVVCTMLRVRSFIKQVWEELTCMRSIAAEWCIRVLYNHSRYPNKSRSSLESSSTKKDR